ncbi:MAG: hypothetical protein R2942_19765 [Ignavibacteria bacterium]
MFSKQLTVVITGLSIQPEHHENIYAADMVDANTGFCVMNQSNRPIYRTTNGGVN